MVVNVDNNRLVDLIGRVYDAALDETLWSGLAVDLAQGFNSSSIAVRIRNSRNGDAPLLACTANMVLPAAVAAEYRVHHWRHDIWANRAAELGLSKVFTSKNLISDDALERTGFYQDWLRKFEVFYIVGSVFRTGPEETCSVGFHRPRARGAYEDIDRRSVIKFLPHLQRALQIRRQMGTPTLHHLAASEALERTGIGTFVVGREGQVLHANGLGVELLRKADAIRLIGGRLATTARSTTDRLISVIARAVDTAAGRDSTVGGAVAVAREGHLPLTILVAPFRPAQNGLGWTAPAAILFVRDPEQSGPAAATLVELFDLTPTEAGIAVALANGRSVDNIARTNRISLNTARTHLKNILAKTHTSRQAQLVALLLQSVASLTV